MIHGGIRWARDHKATTCSKKSCADCATAEGVIALADRREDEVQTEIFKQKIKEIELDPNTGVDADGNVVIVERTKRDRRMKL